MGYPTHLYQDSLALCLWSNRKCSVGVHSDLNCRAILRHIDCSRSNFDEGVTCSLVKSSCCLLTTTGRSNNLLCTTFNGFVSYSIQCKNEYILSFCTWVTTNCST